MPIDPATVAEPSAGTAQARIDRTSAMAAINLRADREDWDEDRRIEALREVDRRVRREERSIADAQATARDAALTIVDHLGHGFTDVTQISSNILSALESGDLRRIAAQAAANENPRPVAEAGDAAARLNIMALRDRAGFTQEDLRLSRHEMSKPEYDALWRLQKAIRTNPAAPDAATNDAVWRKVAVAVPGIMTSENDPVDLATAREGLKLYTPIKRELDRVTEGKRQPTAEEIEQAYQDVLLDGFIPPQVDNVPNFGTQSKENIGAMTKRENDILRASAKGAAGAKAGTQSAAHEPSTNPTSRPLTLPESGVISLPLARIGSTLGADVEYIIAQSPRLMSDLKSLSDQKWNITIDMTQAKSTTSRRDKTIVIGSSGLQGGFIASFLRSLMHEVGHALWSDVPSGLDRQTAIEEHLTAEGAATAYGILIRNDILTKAGFDVGVQGANSFLYKKIYEENHHRLDFGEIARMIGIQMGDNENVGGTTQSYRSYYSDYFDTYGR